MPAFYNIDPANLGRRVLLMKRSFGAVFVSSNAGKKSSLEPQKMQILLGSGMYIPTYV
jgi:hypothetical protein